MPKIPQFISTTSPSSGRLATSRVRATSEGLTSFGAKDAAAIGRGLAGISAGLKARDDVKAAFKEREQAQNESKEIATSVSQMRLDWAKRMREASLNPNENMFDSISDEFEDYKTDVLNSASSPRVSDELKLQLESYQVGLERQSFSLQQGIRAANFGVTFDGMLSNAEDTVIETGSINELQAQTDLLNNFIQESIDTGRVRDKSTINKLTNKVDQVSYAWAKSLVNEDPHTVKQAAEDGNLDMLTAKQRKSLTEQSDKAIESKSKADKVLIRQSFESDKVQIVNTGIGSSFNHEAAVEAFGKTTADAMSRDLERAENLFLISERVKGVDGPTMLSEIEKSKPKSDPESTTFAEEMQHHRDVVSLITKAHQDKTESPYRHYLQDPVIAEMQDNLIENPDDPSIHKALQDQILQRQFDDSTLNSKDYEVMSENEAQAFIQNFSTLIAVGNNQSPDDVRNELLAFEHRFSDNVSYALNQLINTKGGEEVASRINPLLWHVNNPSVFRMSVDAIRKDNKEVMSLFTESEKEEFTDSANLSNEFLNYRNSVLSTDNSVLSGKIVAGTNDTYKKFARDFVVNGGDVKSASETFFSYYNFGDYNNMSFARPRSYTTEDGKTHVLTDKVAELSDLWLRAKINTLAGSRGEEISRRGFAEDQALDPTTVLSSTQFLTEDQIKEDMQDQLKTNAFWSTNETETGVYLFIKGEYPGTAVQVFDTGGEAIQYDFVETYTPFLEATLADFM